MTNLLPVSSIDWFMAWNTLRVDLHDTLRVVRTGLQFALCCFHPVFWHSGLQYRAHLQPPQVFNAVGASVFAYVQFSFSQKLICGVCSK
jgi:hypothetical protein